MDFGGRKEIFRALVGSTNYNLNTASSDKDYKIFVAPTFEDLYCNNIFSKSYIGKLEDFECHDIRKVSNLWWKANVNFLEVLFSEECVVNKKLKIDTRMCLSTIFRHRDEIVRMNLPYLYDACIGMHITKKKQIYKGTEDTQNLVKLYGFDTKQAMHSIRILDFLTRFADLNFEDFKKAIWYDNDNPTRVLLLDIKGGKYSIEEFIDMATIMLELVESQYQPKYKIQVPNEETNQHLLRMVKEIIRTELF